MLPGTRIANLIRRNCFTRTFRCLLCARFCRGWTECADSALAAAISLPEKLADGSDFPHRNLIIFLTFSVILVTLVLQGLTLPPLIRLLGLAGLTGRSKEEEDARRAMIEAALETLRAEQERDGQEFRGEVFNEIEERYRHRLAALAEHDRRNGELAHLARYNNCFKN
jgi:CPA1 family monovalent cation:H+ antiporter